MEQPIREKSRSNRTRERAAESSLPRLLWRDGLWRGRRRRLLEGGGGEFAIGGHLEF